MDKDKLITENLGDSNDVPAPSYVINKNHDEGILEIFNNEINEAIIKIKKKLGTNIGDTNQNADFIMQKLNDLQQIIDNNTQENSTNTNQDYRITVTKDDNRLFTPKIGTKYINDYDHTYDTLKNKNINIENLDTNTNIDEYSIPVKEGKISSQEVQTRLNNCHILEMLYLIKHEEVMKTFAFTLNLFDKYKYSVKLLLFVLKFLVNKKPEQAAHIKGDTPCVDVKLPKTLIPNIQTLLQDQQKVQEVITRMQEQLEANPLGGVNGAKVLNPADELDDTKLDANLRNTSTPQPES